MTGEHRARTGAGLGLFAALSFLGSWFVAATLRVFEVTVAPATMGTRLFTTSLLYALTMGWQPIVATWVVRRWIDPPDRLDLGLRPSRRIFNMVGGIGAITITAAATLVASLAVTIGLMGPSLLHGTAELDLSSRAPSPTGVIVLGAAFLATVALVCTQAFAEEIGWRGYFLPRAMERFGRWRGLLLHGAVWGAWYAPVLFFASYGQLDLFVSLSRSLGFVVTCVLLGTLFGWLRLASRSLLPVVLANTTLTLAAGLPYVIHGVDAGLRSAAFGPPGWLVLLLLLGGLLLSRWRASVQVPEHCGGAAESSTTVLLRVHVLLNRETIENGPARLN